MKTKQSSIFFLLVVIFNTIHCLAQSPAIEWQKSFGGSAQDYAKCIKQTSDGGYIICGYTYSNDGDVTGNHTTNTVFSDYWIVKTNATGTIQWQKTLGGNDNDTAESIQQTTDGGYVVTGKAKGNTGDITGNHGGNGDIWVVKLGSTGDIQWQKCLGGNSRENSNSIHQTSDGGYIVAGETLSNNTGDVIGGTGTLSNYWIVKLSSLGVIEWQKKMGGSGSDIANCIRQTSDGGYIVAGESSSNDGDVSFNYGQTDYWIVKLSSSGTIQWQKSFGGSNFDKAYSITQTTDGGYIIAGETNSNDGNVSGLHGLQDFWIIKVSSTGILEWQKALGGNLGDVAYSIQQTLDGNYIVAGVSESPNGDVVGLHGNVTDFWVVKLNSTGNILWQKCLGGTNDEYAYSIQQTTDSGFIIAGQSNSIDGDATTNQGGYDFWVVKLAPDLLSTNNFKQDNLVLYPNPSNSLLNLEIPNSFKIEKVIILDSNGKIIKEQDNSTQINIESLSSGIYLIQAYSGTKKYQNKFVKQ